MGLRNWLRRLERGASEELESFTLLDGSTYHYDPHRGYQELYLFCADCLKAGNPDSWPEPPELLLRVCEARDPAAALEQVWTPAVGDLFPFDRHVLVNERRLEPRSVVAGRDVRDQEVEDLSE